LFITSSKLKADFVLANPPFNQSDWGQELLQTDARWQYGTPPSGNANFAWMQHMLYHLKPTGVMATVLANGSLSSNTGGEGEIRKNLIQNGLVEAIVALPKQLFYNTGIPACIRFLRRGRKENTDEQLLEKILTNNLNHKEFFVNKAIGWALRDYSKTNPQWVRNFIEVHKENMASLSIREASKYL